MTTGYPPWGVSNNKWVRRDTDSTLCTTLYTREKKGVRIWKDRPLRLKKITATVPKIKTWQTSRTLPKLIITITISSNVMGAVAALFFTNHSVKLSSDSAIGQLAVITCMKEKRGILPRFQNESVLVPKFVEAPKRCLRTSPKPIYFFHILLSVKSLITVNL